MFEKKAVLSVVLSFFFLFTGGTPVEALSVDMELVKKALKWSLLGANSVTVLGSESISDSTSIIYFDANVAGGAKISGETEIKQLDDGDVYIWSVTVGNKQIAAPKRFKLPDKEVKEISVLITDLPQGIDVVVPEYSNVSPFMEILIHASEHQRPQIIFDVDHNQVIDQRDYSYFLDNGYNGCDVVDRHMGNLSSCEGDYTLRFQTFQKNYQIKLKDKKISVRRLELRFDKTDITNQIDDGVRFMVVIRNLLGEVVRESNWEILGSADK